MSSSNFGYRADLANQLRKQFIRLRDEGNLVPWILPPAKKPAAFDKASDSSFPPLIVYDSFQEASKIYRTSPKSRLRKSKLLGGNLMAEQVAGGLGNAPLRKPQGEAANAAFVRSSTRLPRKADDSWVILAKNLANEKASKITHKFQRNFRKSSRGYSVQGDSKSASLRSPPSLVADNSWGILTAALAKERAFKLDDGALTRRFSGTGSKPVAKKETSPQRTWSGRTSGPTRSEMCRSRSPVRRSQRSNESTPPFARVHDQVDHLKEHCKVRTQVNKRQRRRKSISGCGHEVNIPTTPCAKAQIEYTASAASYVSKPFARLKGNVSVHMHCRSIQFRRGQHDSNSGLFLSPTISSQCKADAPRSPIARALLKEKELKLLEGLKQPKAVMAPKSGSLLRRLEPGLVVSPSKSSPSKAADSNTDIGKALTAPMDSKDQKLPIAKKLNSETPASVDCKQLGETDIEFRACDDLKEAQFANWSSKGNLDDHSGQKKFTDCSRSLCRAATANVCEQLINTKVLRLINRIIDDIWPAVNTEVTC